MLLPPNTPSSPTLADHLASWEVAIAGALDGLVIQDAASHARLVAETLGSVPLAPVMASVDGDLLTISTVAEEPVVRNVRVIPEGE